VRPAVDEAKLRNAGELKAEVCAARGGVPHPDVQELRPEFVTQMAAVRAAVMGGACPKRLFGETLTGPMLVTLAQVTLRLSRRR
jgi:hypothetical protein